MFARIPVEKVRIPESRVSARFTPEQEAFFKSSIEKLGVIHEPVVRKLPDGSYELIAGAHRLRELAARGEREVLCKVIEADDLAAIEINLIENVARGDYNPVEISEQLNRYLEKGGSVEDLIRLTGHTREWVEFYLALRKLPELYKKALADGDLRVGHIETASQLPDSQEMAHALDLALSLKWTVTTLEYYVKRRLDDLRLAKALAPGGVSPPPPSRERALEIVTSFECTGCMRAVQKTAFRNPPICEECYMLLRYCTDQFGPPKQAMGYIYEAVRHYQAFLEAQQRYLLAQEQAKVFRTAEPGELGPRAAPPAAGTSPQPPGTAEAKLPEVPAPYPEKATVVEDQKLRGYIKRLIREILEEHSK